MTKPPTPPYVPGGPYSEPPATPPQATPAHAAAQPRPRSRLPWILGGAAVAVVAALVAAILVVGGDDSASPQGIAKTACVDEYVPAKLKAPATAKFSDIAVDQEGSLSYYTVTGSVDAQNSFGALVRSKWSCYVAVEDGKARAIDVRVTE